MIPKVCVFTSETKKTQLPSAIGLVREARGHEGEGWSTAGRPAGSLKEVDPVGSWREARHANARACSAAAADSHIWLWDSRGRSSEGSRKRRESAGQIGTVGLSLSSQNNSHA